MRYVVRYEMADGAGDRIQDVYPRHRAYVDEFATGGELMLLGPLLPVPDAGALSVFRTREAAERFPAGDSFVLEGLAVPRPIEEWEPLEFL